MSEYITDAEIDEMVRRLEAHVAVDIRTALRDAVLWGARYAEVRQQSKSGTFPKEPPPGLLESMAVRFDHGIGVPGYYDSVAALLPGPSHAERLQAALVTMRQLYEEVSGHGFFKWPEQPHKPDSIRPGHDAQERRAIEPVAGGDITPTNSVPSEEC